MSSSVISISGGTAFLYAFFIEQPHNTGTIARTANNIFSYVSPLSISLCYLLLHILMRKQGRESRASLLEFSTQMARNSEKGRDFRGCFLRISTQTTQIGKIGRDSRGCLLEFSTQMAGNSENGRDSQAQLIENLYPNNTNRQNR